jgi:streptogramin lyase
VPTALGNPTGLYHVAVAANGDIRFPSNGANALVPYTPDAGTITFYQLAVPASSPYGLALDATGHVWFTADGVQANYIGGVVPR